MRTAYRVLAYLVAIEVVIQAAAIAFALFGFTKWIEKGNTFDKTVLESDTPPEFLGGLGFPIHGINGQMLVPLIALILLIVSFFAKVPRGVMWAGIIVVLVALQIALGILGGAVSGLFHGINALVLFGIAVTAAQQAKPAKVLTTPASDTTPAGVD
jgi:hypothetical protein